LLNCWSGNETKLSVAWIAAAVAETRLAVCGNCSGDARFHPVGRHCSPKPR
jgi:hypothetical protein